LISGGVLGLVASIFWARLVSNRDMARPVRGWQLDGPVQGLSTGRNGGAWQRAVVPDHNSQVRLRAGL